MVTSITVVAELPQLPEMVYVIVNDPDPATEGSKTPLLGSVIPVPDHTPPGDAAERVIGFSLLQKGPTLLIVASNALVTLIIVEAVFPQFPEMVYVIV